MFTLSIIFLILVVAFGLWTIWPRKRRHDAGTSRKRRGITENPANNYFMGSAMSDSYGVTPGSSHSGFAAESPGEPGNSSPDYGGSGGDYGTSDSGGSDYGGGDFGGGGSGGDFGGGDSGGGDGGGSSG